MRWCCLLVIMSLGLAAWAGTPAAAGADSASPLVERGTGAGDSALSLSPQQVVSLALQRDALVRDAQQALDDAKAALARARVHTPRMNVSSYTSAASSAGLDPQSEITGTDWSSHSYLSDLNMPLPGGLSVGLSTATSTSTTNSTFREGNGESYSYAGAGVGLNVTRPLPLLRDERVLTEGDRWAAALGVRQAELTLQEARRQVASEALNRFFTALQAQRRVEVARASLQDTEEFLRISEEKLARGKLAEVEVMKAKVGVSSARVSLRSSESAAATAFDALKNFLGLPLEGSVEARYDPPEAMTTDPLEEEALTAQAFAQRPDLQQLALGLELAQLSVKQSEARSRPGVMLTAGYGLSGQGPTIVESWNQLINPSWGFGLSTSFSLNRSEDRLGVQQAENRLRLSRLNEQLRRDSVRLEIRRIARTVQDAAANAGVLAEAVTMAEESLRVSQTQFEHGLIRPIEVMEAERQLMQARNQHLDAVIAYQLARVELTLALGKIPYAAEEARPPAADATTVVSREGDR